MDNGNGGNDGCSDVLLLCASASATTETDSAADVDVAVAAVASDDVHCCFGRLCCVLCLFCMCGALWCASERDLGH